MALDLRVLNIAIIITTNTAIINFKIPLFQNFSTKKLIPLNYLHFNITVIKIIAIKNITIAIRIKNLHYSPKTPNQTIITVINIVHFSNYLLIDVIALKIPQLGPMSEMIHWTKKN